MTYSEEIRIRYEEIVRRSHRAILELVDIVSERARAKAREDPSLLARTEALVRNLLECQRDTWQLRADVAQEQLDNGAATAEQSLEGLVIPDFMPEEI